MATLNQWYVFHEAMTNKVIKKLWKVVGDDWETSTVDTSTETTLEERKKGKKQKFGLNKEVRISDVIWNNDQWLYDTIWPYMMQANREAGWNYEIVMAESVQITRYKVGGYYNWHIDGCHDNLSAYQDNGNAMMDGLVRKLSMTVLLNDKFEGGEFEIMHYSKGKSEISRPFEDPKKGQIIVFPSMMEHRVAPVTKGTRYSAVIWFLGPPMR